VTRTGAFWAIVLKVLRWLCIIPLSYVTGIAFWLVTGYLMLLYPLLLNLASQARIPPQTTVSFARIGFLLAGLCVFVLPLAVYAGFLTRKRMRLSFQWAFSGALLLLAYFVWASDGKASPVAAHIAAIAGCLIVLAGVVFAFRLRRGTVQWGAGLLALFVFTVPIWLAWATAPAQPTAARRLWSVVLQHGTWQAMNTGSEFAARRQLVFAKDRIVAVFDTQYPTYEGKQPMSVYRLVSMNLSSGKIENTRELKGPWGAMPFLFATSDGHVVLSAAGRLQLLNSDLSQTGQTFAGGDAYDVSPDGRMLAVQTVPGIRLLNSNTLSATDIRFQDGTPTSVSADAVITDKISWNGKYPKGEAFVTVEDQGGQRLIFHGECGSRPSFLSNSRILLMGCGDMRLLDTQGQLVTLHKLDCCYAGFAGVSQDGQRFALHFSDEKGDPARLLYEQFVIYEANSLMPVAMVVPETLGERQSWSAFSPDGKYFVCGNPDAVSVYQLPGSH
jgi:hypothetical protein